MAWLLPRRPWNRDVNRAGFGASAGASSIAVDEAPQLGRAAMAEDGAVPTGKHGRHPPPLVAEPVMSDGINTAMNGVETAGCGAPPNPA